MAALTHGRNSSSALVPGAWLFLGVLLLLFGTDAPAQQDSSYAIVSVRYHVDLYPSERALRCTDTLRIRFTADVPEQISFRLVPLYEVSSVSVAGRAAAFSVSRDRLLIGDLPKDTAIDIVVEYAGRIPMKSEFAQIEDERAVFHEQAFLPTGPYALRMVRGAITVPNGWQAIAAGALSALRRENDSLTYVWESLQSQVNVGWICAGVYRHEELRDGALSLNTYLAHEDSASAPSILARAREVVAFYSGWFTPYRFPKLAIVEVDNSVAGRNVLAIAAPSMILVKKLAFESTDVFNQVESVLPHEVAHQWWPMTVYIDDEDAALLSEGMCEYSALVYAESSGRMTSRDSLARHPLLRPLLARVAKGEEQPLRQKADLRYLQTHYLKASYVHNMLREILGDSLFRLVYARYAEHYSLRKARMEDFQAVAEHLSGRSLGWFFRQWVTGRGIPRLKIYNVKTASAPGGWITRGRVRMLGYEKYTALVRISAQSEGERADTVLWVGADSSGAYRNDAPFEIRSSARPSRVLLDPDGDLLKIQKIPAKLGELRDGASGLMIIGTGLHEEHLRGLARRDSAAMELGGWSIAMKADTAVTLMDLQRGNVFLYGTTRENRLAAELAAKFPMTCAGDSVIVEGEVLRDSTLALVQAIENPYRSSGMLCWIAPLSASARVELQPYDDSWVLMRGSDIVGRGVWDVRDEDLVVEIPPEEPSGKR